MSSGKPKEVVPGSADRVEKSDLPPANWFSVDYETVRAIAETHAEGDRVYGMGNWRKGLPASNLLNHAMEHLFKMLEGDTTEPHLEHCLWNLGKLRWMANNKPDMIDVPMLRAYFGLDIRAAEPSAVPRRVCAVCNRPLNPGDDIVEENIGKTIKHLGCLGRGFAVPPGID